MKKIIALLLVLVMSLSLFAGCAEQGNTNTTAGKTGTVKDAKEYLYAMYKDSSVAVLRDFSRVAVVAINGVSYKVTWTVDVAEDLVKITTTDTMATIDINEKPAEDVTFKLTATIEDAEGNKETVEFTHTIAAVATTGTLFVEKFEVGTAYKFALKQAGLDGAPVLYFTGEKSGNYLATSTNPMDAVDVTVEETEGGYHLTFMDGETKKYINITTYTKDDGSLSKTQDIGTEPTCVYKWDAERKTFVAEIKDLGSTFYLGTYGTYNTISTSDVKYIENLEVIGATQFPAGLCTINAADVEKPETNKAYLFGMQQNGIDGQPTLYFTGEKSGNYLATSTSMKDAVRVYVEEVDGGYHLFFYKDGTKMFINITTYTKDDGSKSKTQDIGTEPTCVYKWDAERKTFVAEIKDLGSTFYLGTYGTYNTISTSDVKYIENLEVIGVSQFPAGLYDLGLPVEEVKPNEGDDNNDDNKDEKPAEAQLPTVTAPEAGKAYKFGMVQVNNGHTVYIAGGIDQDRYLVTTEDKAAALDVYVEASGDGFKFKVTIDGADAYITIGLNDAGKVALSYTAEGTVWKHDATISAWCAEVDGTMYYMGSYNTFDTISASKTSYIKEDNKGVTQFPAGFFEA